MRNSDLVTLQGELQTVQTDAMGLVGPSLYQPSPRRRCPRATPRP
jgi:hypothetical protein